ncbi:uncharacterized protein At1g66480 isoform X1 [Zea mays]|nr:uncharacterized protein At1g66480 isoform X1 [Zea mays]|eukprot:XP_008664669.1 uncharacterized protein At1g66480 isoform X1 [Zea mays]
MHAVFISLSALPPRLTETFANAKPISLDRYVYVQCSAGTDNNHHMGNSMGGKRRRARVMTVDGTTYKYRAPAAAGDALREHPGKGNHLLESEEVRRLGLRARPLDPDAPLKPGKLYFLVELPPPSSAAHHHRRARAPQRTWSGALHYGAVAGAGERLESLMLARRSASDVAASSSVGDGGALRLRVRLPKADVQRLVDDSRDAADAAERIMQLCVARDQQRRHRSAPATPLAVPVPPAVVSVTSTSSSRKDDGSGGSNKPAAATTGKKEKRARFVTVPDEIIGF